MHELVSHAARQLVRRTLTPDQDASDRLRGILEDISPAAWTTMILTAFASLIFYGLVVYTLHLVFTLAAVENDEQAFLVSAMQPPAYKDINSPATNEETAPLTGPAEDSEVLLMTQKPITSSIRGTIRHLHSTGGFFARWRGFSMGAMWFLCFMLLDELFAALLTVALTILMIVAPFLSPLLARIVMARWEMGWTQMMISQPSSKPWYRRTPATDTWKNVWAATAINHLVRLLAMVVPAVGFFLLGLDKKLDTQSEHGHVHRADTFKLLALFLLWCFSFWVLALPANVALIRVQASMLPSEQEAIVPYDKTFGGRVIAKADGGSGALGFADAWRSLTRQAKIRILKIYVKAVAIELAIIVLCGMVFVVELCYFVLPAVNRGTEDPDDSLKL